MVRCTATAAASEYRSFDLVMNLSQDGSVNQVLVRPETSVALCVREAVRGDIFPAPPMAGYWVHIHMSITD